MAAASISKDLLEAVSGFTKPTYSKKEKVKSAGQIDCEAKGGTWDEARQVCILPTPEETPKEDTGIQTPEETALTTPETFRNKQGNLSGITLPDGRTFFGLSPDEVREISERERLKAEQPEGTSSVGTAVQVQRDIQKKIQSAKNVGQIDLATAQQLEEQGIDVKQAFAAGIGNIASSSIGFAAAGAGAGLVTGGTASLPLAAIGAGAGAIKGFYTGVTNNIKNQRKDLVSVKTKELKQRKTAIQNYISAANANPSLTDEYVSAMNIELSLIRRDYNTLSKKGNEDLRFWGEDATSQLVEYEVFFESTEPSLILKMQQAVLKPDPTRAYISLEEE